MTFVEVKCEREDCCYLNADQYCDAGDIRLDSSGYCLVYLDSEDTGQCRTVTGQ